MSRTRASARSWHSSSPADAERPLAAGRKPSQRSPHIRCFRLVATSAPDACDRAAAPRRAPRSHRGGVEPPERKPSWAQHSTHGLRTFSPQRKAVSKDVARAQARCRRRCRPRMSPVTRTLKAGGANIASSGCFSWLATKRECLQQSALQVKRSEWRRT